MVEGPEWTHCDVRVNEAFELCITTGCLNMNPETFISWSFSRGNVRQRSKMNTKKLRRNKFTQERSPERGQHCDPEVLQLVSNWCPTGGFNRWNMIPSSVVLVGANIYTYAKVQVCSVA